MYPVECSLHIGKAGLQTANHVLIRGDAETDAVHHARKTYIRFRHYVDIGFHSGPDVLELAFTEVSNSPPRARVDEREHLLAHMGVSAFGNGEVGHASIERGVDPAIVEVVAGVLHRGCPGPTLVDERFEGGDGMRRLLVLSLALFQDSP